MRIIFPCQIGAKFPAEVSSVKHVRAHQSLEDPTLPEELFFWPRGNNNADLAATHARSTHCASVKDTVICWSYTVLISVSAVAWDPDGKMATARVSHSAVLSNLARLHGVSTRGLTAPRAQV